MYEIHPLSVLAYHSIDLETGMNILLGKDELRLSENPWDWLGPGVYFWEHNPTRALEYAEEVARRMQFNKKGIKTPFVLGAIINLRNCLNLTEGESLGLLKDSYSWLRKLQDNSNTVLPENDGPKRLLDCAVIKYIHQTRIGNNLPPFDTVRGAFPEGDIVYPTSEIRDRTHIQVCVLNQACIIGYFLPKPIEKHNPYLPEYLQKLNAPQ